MTYTGTKWAERLNYLAAVEDGWYDGEGEAIKPEVLDQANNILHSLDSAIFNVPAMFPLLDNDADEDEFLIEGGIIMEWSKAHHPHHLSLQISNNFTYEVYVIDFSKKEATTSLETASYDEALHLLSQHLIRVGFAEPAKTSEGLPK